MLDTIITYHVSSRHDRPKIGSVRVWFTHSHLLIHTFYTRHYTYMHNVNHCSCELFQHQIDYTCKQVKHQSTLNLTIDFRSSYITFMHVTMSRIWVPLDIVSYPWSQTKTTSQLTNNKKKWNQDKSTKFCALSNHVKWTNCMYI